MKIKRQFRMEEVASKDETRPHLLHPHLDVEKGLLCATDGHCLAVVKVEVGADDKSGPIPREALIEARRTRKEPTIRARKTLLDVNSRVMYRRPLVIGKFPDIDAVIPKFKSGDKGTASVTFDPRLLMKVTNAIGGDKVTLTFLVDVNGKQQYEPIVVRSGGDADSVGLVMPCKR